MNVLDRTQQLIDSNLLDTVFVGKHYIIIATKDNQEFIYHPTIDDQYATETKLVQYGYPKAILQPLVGTVYSVDIHKIWWRKE